MKKGFTLVELLIIVVIVGILVTLALPKYKMALERGRAMEAMTTVAAISDALNVCYIQHYNKYDDCSYSFAAMAKESDLKYFDIDLDIDPDSSNIQRVPVDLRRTKYVGTGEDEDYLYIIHFDNQNGETKYRYCTGQEKYCRALGAVNQNTGIGGGWSF